jgi:hypothetical protein
LLRITADCAPPARIRARFDPADVEVRVETADGENDVDVGGDDLGASAAPGGRAGENRAPCKHAVDDGGAIGARRVLQGDPIADGGEPVILQPRAKFTGKPGAACAGSGPDHVRAAVLGGDPGGDGVGVFGA